MKKIILILISLTIFGAEAKQSDFSQMAKAFHSEKLEKVYKEGGLDALISDLAGAMAKLNYKYSRVKPDAQGLKIKDKDAQNLIVKLVESADYISEKIDGSGLHMYIFAKFYKAYPKDLLLALKRSDLSEENKGLFRETLQANLEGDR